MGPNSKIVGVYTFLTSTPYSCVAVGLVDLRETRLACRVPMESLPWIASRLGIPGLLAGQGMDAATQP